MAKKILVFGGGSDIGSAIVKKFAALGHEVVWTYWSTDREQPGRKLRFDLRAPDHVEIDELFRAVGTEFDLVVTAAFPFQQASNLDRNRFHEALSFLSGHMDVLIESAKRLKRGGRIVNMLGQCVHTGLPGAAFYSAAFAFLHNYGLSLNAKEGREGRLAVCDLLLGPVDSREWDGIAPAMMDMYKSRVVQFVPVEQVADTVLFLSESPVMPTAFTLDGYYGLPPAPVEG